MTASVFDNASQQGCPNSMVAAECDIELELRSTVRVNLQRFQRITLLSNALISQQKDWSKSSFRRSHTFLLEFLA